MRCLRTRDGEPTKKAPGAAYAESLGDIGTVGLTNANPVPRERYRLAPSISIVKTRKKGTAEMQNPAREAVARFATIHDACVALDVSRATIQSLLSGSTRDPRPATVYELARVLESDPATVRRAYRRWQRAHRAAVLQSTPVGRDAA